MPTEEEVKDLKEEYSADNSIINNKNTKTDTLYRINLVLILVYYLLLGFFVYSIYSKIKQSPQFLKKSILIVFLFLYPIIIFPLQYNIYGIFESIIHNSYQNIYLSKDW